MAAAFLRLGAPYGLVADDIKSTSMGVNGVDVQFSPAAKIVFGYLPIECKNVENLNVTSTFVKHATKYALNPVLCHKRNRTNPMVTISLEHFLTLLAAQIEHSKV